MANKKKSRSARTHGNAALSFDTLEDDGATNADLSQCRHGYRDDQDCVECRTEGCGGGADCSCGDHHSRKNPPQLSRF
jgi:hypothetical protein